MTTLALNGHTYAADFASKCFVNVSDDDDAFSFSDFQLLVTLTKFAVRHMPHVDASTAAQILLTSLSFDAAYYLPASSDTKQVLAMLARFNALEAQPSHDDSNDFATVSPSTRPNSAPHPHADPPPLSSKAKARLNKLRARQLREHARERT